MVQTANGVNTRIRAHFDRCTGCAICQLECSYRCNGGYNPRLAMLRLENGPEGLYAKPVVCHQCENAFCEKVCPHGAISRSEKMGIPEIDPEKCRKCGMCQRYCPEQVIVRTEAGHAAKCDLCEGSPRCVEVCPAGALTLVQEVTANE